MTTTTKLAPLPCPNEACEDGKVHVEEQHVFSRCVFTATCDECHGSGHARCAACKETATLLGEDGETPFCGVACAWDDHNWPACPICQEDPQDPALAPFCSAACEGFLRSRVEVVRAPAQAGA